MNLQSRNLHYQLLFDDGESICPANYDTTKRIVTLEQALSWAPQQYTVINPLFDTRKDAHCSSLRTLVFESDKISCEEWRDLVVKSQLPYSAIVFSGNKSEHVFLTLEEPLPDVMSFKRLYKQVLAVLGPTAKSDTSMSNPSRLARTAGAIRPDTGKEQQLVDLRARVPTSVLNQWLKDNEYIIRLAEEEEAHERAAALERLRAKQAAGVDNAFCLLEPGEQRFLEGELGGTRCRHSRLYAIMSKCAAYGMDWDEACARALVCAEETGLLTDRAAGGVDGEAEVMSILYSVYGGVHGRVGT